MPIQPPRADERPAHQQKRAFSPLKRSRPRSSNTRCPRLDGWGVKWQVAGLPHRMPGRDGKAVRAPGVDHAPVVGNMALVHFGVVADLERGEPVNAEMLVYEEERVEELALLLVVHLAELLRIGQAVGDLPSDSDYRGFVNAVDVQRHPIGLPYTQRGQYPLFTVHLITSAPDCPISRDPK